MPSIQHAIASWVIPIMRRNMPADDIPAMRAAHDRDNRIAARGPARGRTADSRGEISNAHGFPVFTLWRQGASRPRRAVVYLHGGAYVRPADPRHWRFATRLADALGARAVLPRYPLAPEFTVDDSFEAMIDAPRGDRRRVTGWRRTRRRLGGRWLRAGPGRGTSRPRRRRARPAGPARALGRPHRARRGHHRGSGARPVAVPATPAHLRRVLGRNRRSRSSLPTRGSVPALAISADSRRR